MTVAWMRAGTALLKRDNTRSGAIATSKRTANSVSLCTTYSLRRLALGAIGVSVGLGNCKFRPWLVGGSGSVRCARGSGKRGSSVAMLCVASGFELRCV